MAIVTTYGFANLAPEYQVNAAAAGSQTAASLAWLSNGNIAFAFQDPEVALPNQDVSGNIRSPAGSAVSGDVEVQAGIGDLETAPRLAALSGGNVVVAYTDSSAAGSFGGTSTASRIFQPDGTALPGAPAIMENEIDDQTAPDIAALGSGFVVVHLDQSMGSATVNAITAQRYSSDGTANGGLISVANSANASPLGAPRVAALSDGGFVVVWAADVLAGAGENHDIFAQRYSSAGAANGALITINSEADNQTNPVVAALAGNGFAVAWEDELLGSAANGNIDFTTVSNTGVVGGVFELAAGGRQERPSIAALSQGVFVIGYQSNQNGNQDVFAAAANGTAGVLATLAIDTQAGTQNQPAVAATRDGAFTTAWTDANGDGSGSRISAQQDRLVRKSIGDGAGNLINGDALRDLADGGAGNDILNGGDGDDTLQGGQGADTLTAGGGNDLLFAMTQATPTASPNGDSLNGESGDDTIIGADGNDTILGGGGADVIQGHGGGDVLQGVTERDTINGGDGDDIIFANTLANANGSPAGDLLSGDAGDDVITGSRGDDAIFGGTGEDWLIGGDGQDSLYGGPGPDLMEGGVGDDQFVVNELGDVVAELPGEGGADTAHVGINGWTNFAGVEIVRLLGAVNAVTGSAGDEQIVANGAIAGGSTIFAQAGHDVLWGSAFGDVLDGGAGNDVLRGGAGADLLYGGDGVDIYVVEELADQMFETPGGGYDTAYVAANNYVMPESAGSFAAYIEVAYLAGTAVSLNGSGSGENLVANSTLGSVLAGFGGNDILWGSNFGDSFTGGTQDDVIYTNGGADAVRFVESNWGWDQVADFTPGAGDRLVFAAGSGVTSFGQLAFAANGGNTTVLFGGSQITLYNYVELNAADCLFIA